MRKILYIVLILFPFSAFCATEASPKSKIKSMVSYSEYGGGDVQVVLESNGTICVNRYFLKKLDPGFDANMAMLLAAYHSKSTIRIYGHTDQKWAGSSGYYCHVYQVSYGY